MTWQVSQFLAVHENWRAWEVSRRNRSTNTRWDLCNDDDADTRNKDRQCPKNGGDRLWLRVGVGQKLHIHA